MDLDRALESALRRVRSDRIAPGLAVIAGDADEVAGEVFAGDTADAGDGGAQVNALTIYDLASLTKPLATTALAMETIASGAIDLADRAAVHSARFDRDGLRGVAIEHLLGHAAGFPAHREFYRELRRAELRGAPDSRSALIDMAAEVELEAGPGQRAVYSDIGYILLGDLLEQVHGARLDALFARLVAAPLAMDSAGFRPIGEVEPGSSGQIAPTERDPDRGGLIVGEVHDENAHVAGGVCGHAGLFGTGADVAAFAIAMCFAFRGEANALVDPAVAVELAAHSAAPNTSWRLGWDTPSPPPVRSHAGDLWPRSGLGHLGFTGTSLWLDPPRGRFAIILTNRVYYGRDPDKIRGLRREIMDAIWTWLESRGRQ